MFKTILASKLSEQEKENFKKNKFCPNIVGIIQARENSTRFPNKIYADLKGAPVLYHVIDAAKRSKLLNSVIVASPSDIDVPEGIVNMVSSIDENDVLARYFLTAKDCGADYIVRLTSDCPLLDPELIDFIIYSGVEYQADYCSNVVRRTFPDGLDAELISYPTLKYLNSTIRDPYHREHVTTFIREFPDSFDVLSIEQEKNEGKIKWSIDTPKDLEEVSKII